MPLKFAIDADMINVIRAERAAEKADERERCAKIALDTGRHYGETAVGSAIANAIRAQK